MTRWWQSLQPRERRTLLLGGIALAAMVLFFMVWRPLHQRVDSLAERVDSQRDTLAWMRSAAAEVLTRRGAAPAASATGQRGGEALYAMADRTARQAGLAGALQRVEPAGEGQVRVTLEQAAFDDLLAWLRRLGSDFGITADPVSLRRAEGPGQVSGQLVLREPVP